MKLMALETKDGLFKIIDPAIKVGDELVDLTTPNDMTLKNREGQEFVKECMCVKTVQSQISFICPTELIDSVKKKTNPFQTFLVMTFYVEAVKNKKLSILAHIMADVSDL